MLTQVTGDPVARADRAQQRRFSLAPRLGIGTAGMECAAGGRVDWARNITLQQVLPASHPRVRNWDGCQQRFGVGVKRTCEQGLLVGVFDDLAKIHYRDVVAYVLDNCEIVGDEQGPGRAL